MALHDPAAPPRPDAGERVRRDAPASAPARTPPTPGEHRQDLILACCLFVLALISGALSSISEFYGEHTADLVWVIPFAIGTTWPLALRKRFPVPVAAVIVISFFFGQTFYVPEAFVSNVAMFVAVYTIGAWVNNRRVAVASRAAIMAGIVIWLLISTMISVRDAADDSGVVGGAMSPLLAVMLIQWLINAAYFGGAYYLGDHAYRAALGRQALRTLAAQLEEERELSASQAVALDRVRIARELHDVVGHHVSAMGVQAGAARAILSADPDRAAGVLREVEEGARTAIDELHHLLDTLRDPEAGADAPSALRLRDLDELVRQVSAAGTPTRMTVIGDEAPLPPLVETSLYRIAQEALTNARRHGGPGATADVRLRYAPSSVELEVTNTGRVRAGARPGIGQLGMRERATAIGGVLHFGRRATAGEGSAERSGYLVRVIVPLGERVQNEGSAA